MTEGLVERVVPPLVARAVAGFLLSHEELWDEWRDLYGVGPGLNAASVALALKWAASASGSLMVLSAGAVPTSVSMDETISTKKAAEDLKVTTSRVRQRLRDGELDGELVDGRWMIRMERKPA